MRAELLLLPALVLIGCAIVQGDEKANDANRLPYEGFLFAAGEKLGCYFTVEMMWNPTQEKPFSSFSGLLIRDEKLATVDALVAKLEHDIPGVEVMRAGDKGRILHLVERRLKRQKDYAIEQEAALDFSGVLEELPDTLGKTVPGIGSRKSGLTGELGGDFLTTVKIRLKKEKIRDVLTDAVPLENYGRILWIATTAVQGEQARTSVTYIGAKETETGRH